MESSARRLGMSVVAEGVESFEELAYLLGATRIASPRAITLPSRSFSKRSSKRLALPEMSALFRSSGCGRRAGLRPRREQPRPCAEIK